MNLGRRKAVDHAPDLAAQFAMESIAQTQLSTLLSHWSYQGIGLVEDPWLSIVSFTVRA